MKRSLLTVAAVAVVAAFAPFAKATLIAYDGFDTTNSSGALSTAGDTDTNGWSTANNNSSTNYGTNGWEPGSGHGDGQVGTNLTYPGVTTGGNSALMSNSSSAPIDFRQLATPTTTQTVWISVLVNSSSDSGVKEEMSLYSSGNESINNPILMDFGLLGQSSAIWDVDNGYNNGASSFTNSTANSTYDTFTANTTTRLVLEFTFGSTLSSDTTDTGAAYLWVNPSLTAQPSTSTAAASTTLSAAYNGQGIDGIRLYNNQTTGATSNWDELYLGTTYADVVGTPEPAALALFAPMAALMIGRRRR